MPNTATQPPSANRSEPLVHTEVVMPANWPEACAEFARAHHGRSVRVLSLPTPAADRGDLAEARHIAAGMPLDDVVAVAAMPLPNIDIRIRDDQVRTVQRVELPKTVSRETSADGRILGLRIDDTDGVTTLVRVETSLTSA